MIPLIILFGTAIVIGAGLLFYAQKSTVKNTNRQPKPFANERAFDLSQLYNIEGIYEGVVHLSNGEYLMLAGIEGVNFSVLSEAEQNARESALVEIFTGLSHPIRFLSCVVVADTSAEAKKVAETAAKTPGGNLKTYRTLYAGMLETMRQERRILSQYTYMFIPGKTREEVAERLFLIETALRERARLVVTPIRTTDEVYLILQNIFMPDRLTRPAEVAVTGVTSPIHYSGKEAEAFVANA